MLFNSILKWSSRYKEKLIFGLFISAILSTSQLSFAQVLDVKIVNTAGITTDIDCYEVSWTVGEPVIIENSSIISGQQGYLARRISPTINSSSLDICDGKEVVFKSNDSLFFDSLQWFVDDYEIIGANSGTYKPAINGKYKIALWNDDKNCKYFSPELDLSFNGTFQTPNIVASNSPIDRLTTTSATRYQWFVNNKIIVGETNKDYIVRYNGNYHVMVVYANDCRAFSNIFTVNNSSYVDISRANAVFSDTSIVILDQVKHFMNVYPNPVEEQINLYISSDLKQFTLELYNLEGKIIKEVFYKEVYNEKVILDVNDLSAGLYYLKVTNSGKSESIKIFKTK